MYVTGGIGSSAHNEGFTGDYDLPNLTAYQETCASIAMMMWNQRLALVSGEAKYADMLELALYNGFLAGVSLDGRRYFYVNPLASDGEHHRQEWFGCACCPPNVTRTLASLGGYAYASRRRWPLGEPLHPGQRTGRGRRVRCLPGCGDGVSLGRRYPDHGHARARNRPSRCTCVCPAGATWRQVQVNGALIPDAPNGKGYLTLDRAWEPAMWLS